MNICEGTSTFKKDGVIKTAIIEYQFDYYSIYVYQGDISSFDIIVKYKKDRGRQRQPSHIHWAVDILLKIQGNKALTQELLKKFHDFWLECEPLYNNDFVTLKSLIENGNEKFDIQEYSELNNFGEFSVEFLYVLIQLLAVQEKTNRNDAYMFGDVINSLLKEDIDIYSVISAAKYH